MRALLSHLVVWRWWRTAKLLLRGVRVHPTAITFGAIRWGRGAKVGPRCRLEVSPGGALSLGPRTWLSSDVEMQTDSQITIGEGTTIQRRSTVNGSVRMGAGCILAPNVFISSGTHPFREFASVPIREQEARLAAAGRLGELDRPVWIQDDCWLGANVVVCPGVRIGKGCVVGANAVVTRDLAPYAVAVGTPARVVGRRMAWAPPRSFEAGRHEDRAYLLSSVPPGRAGGTDEWIEVSAEWPFEVAMAAAGAVSIVVQGESTAPVDLECNGHRFHYDGGPVRLQADVRVDPAAEVVHCSLRVHAGVLRVRRVDLATVERQ